MSFRRLVRDYLTNIEEIYSNCIREGRDTELPLRPAVTEFISRIAETINPDVRIRHEAGTQYAGKPDWRFDDQVTLGIFAYGDHKSLNAERPLEIARHMDQFNRYLTLGRPLLVSDGIDFVLLEKGKPDLRCSLIPKPLPERNWSSIVPEETVLGLFQQILEAAGFRRISDYDLIRLLASRARLLASSIHQFIGAPLRSGSNEAENRLIDNLHELKRVIEHHHDPSLREDQSCADFIAQVLSFGLLYAHRTTSFATENPDERRQMILEFWDSDRHGDAASRLRPFKALVDLLEEELVNDNADTEVAEWYEDISRILSYAECVQTEDGIPDYHVLFEEFFKIFDPDTRFERGAFYTPPDLIDFVVRVAGDYSHRYFNANLYDRQNRIIDPCCGTGGFLERMIESSIAADGHAEFTGLEVLPAPYALAQYRLYGLIGENDDDLRLEVLLTDTLSDAVNLEHLEEERNEFDVELHRAQHRSATPIVLVIGNPPSTFDVVSLAERTYVTGLLDQFRPPEEIRADRQNIQKALNNEYVRFLAWATNRVMQSGQGFIALVVPNTFGINSSFQWARRWILENFREIYVLYVDNDGRSGIDNQSLFETRQGRMVLLAATPVEHADERTSIRFYSIVDLDKSEKRQILQVLTLNDFEAVEVNDPTSSFIPILPYDRETYEHCWRLVTRGNGQNYIFHQKCSGVKTGLTRALFSVSDPMLRRRSREIGEPARAYNDLVDRWFRGIGRPPAEEKLTNQQVREAIRNSEPHPYSFRPFVDGYINFDDAVIEHLRRLGGDGTRARPEILAAYRQGAIGLAIAPAPRDIGDELTRFSSIAWHLPDNDISSRGNAMIHCDRFPDVKPSRGEWNDAARSNVNPRIVDLFTGNEFPDNPERSTVFYCHAVLSCDVYLTRFEAALYTTADPENPPRVPIVADNDIRCQIANLGMRIAHCETLETDVLLPLELEEEVISASFRLEGANLYVEDGALELFDEHRTTQMRVFRIPPEVLHLRISGYDVIQSWLKERRYIYLRREFQTEDLRELIATIRRIHTQQTLLEQVSDLLRPHLDRDGLVNPND